MTDVEFRWPVVFSSMAAHQLMYSRHQMSPPSSADLQRNPNNDFTTSGKLTRYDLLSKIFSAVQFIVLNVKTLVEIGGNFDVLLLSQQQLLAQFSMLCANARARQIIEFCL